MLSDAKNATVVNAPPAASGSVNSWALVTYNWNPSTQLAHYLGAQADVVAGKPGTTVKIVAAGDSTTLGFGGSAGNYRATVSYPAELATFLTQDGVAAQMDNFLGQGNEDNNVPDTRIQLTGGAVWGYPFVAGGPVVVTNGVAQGLTFKLNVPAVYDRVSVYYIDSGNGDLNVSLNGGPQTTQIHVGSTGKISSQEIAIPLSSYSSISVTSASAAPVEIEGVSFSNSKTPSVQVFNAGVGGAESSIVGDGVSQAPGVITGAAALGANLALINFGINDILQNNITAAQTAANIGLMIGEFRAIGADPIIIIPQPISPTNYLSEIATLRADIEHLAVSLNVPVIDLSATFNDDAPTLLSAGLLGSDGIHPTATFYAQVASGIAALLTSASNSTSGVTEPVLTPPVVTQPVITPPVVTFATAPSVSNGGKAALGTATASGTDPLVAVLISDASFPSGSSIEITNGTIYYMPATIAAPGSDLISYKIVDTVNGTATAEAQSVTLVAPLPPMVSSPAVNPTQATSIGSGPDSFSLYLSEDAYLGDAQFIVSVDGAQIGGTQTATASHGMGQEQALTVYGAFGTQHHSVTVDYLNDAYAGTATTDRNLYVDSILSGGVSQNTHAALLGSGPQSFDVATSSSNATSASPVTSATSSLAATSIGTGPDTLTLQISEDAYIADAQFTVAVNGVQVGGVQTAKASHVAGASQTFNVSGNFAGPSQATVTFLNDYYAGTASTDRNLYLTGASIDGNTIAGVSLTELSGGPMSFIFQGPAASPRTSPVVLSLSEDAYLGDAQFTVSIDGGPASAPQSVVASHAAGAFQAFNLGALAAGSHDISVSFVNDIYGGTPATDRNLYVNGITVNGSAVSNSTADLLGDWTTHFTISVPSS